jgi:hypothetical protein
MPYTIFSSVTPPFLNLPKELATGNFFGCFATETPVTCNFFGCFATETTCHLQLLRTPDNMKRTVIFQTVPSMLFLFVIVYNLSKISLQRSATN